MARRVLMVACQFPPHGGVGVLRTLKFCKYLPSFGWSSVVLSHRLRPGFDPQDPALLEELPEDTPVFRPGFLDPQYLYARTGAWLRRSVARGDGSPGAAAGAAMPGVPRGLRQHLRTAMVVSPDNRAGWWLPAVLAALNVTRRCDCIFATGPPFTCYLVGHTLHRWTGVPLVLDLRDPWSFNPWLPAEPAWCRPLHAWWEGRCVARAAVVVSSTQEITQEFRRVYPELPADRFVTIPNGFDAEDMDVQPPSHRIPRPDEPMTVAYFGSLYGNRDPGPLFAALRRLKDRGPAVGCLQVLFVGPRNEAALARAAASGVADVVQPRGRLPYRQALALMRGVCVLLILGATDSDRYCVATKTYEYMAAGRPILALVPPGPIQRLVEAENLGRVAPPDDPEQIATALEAFLREHRSGILSGQTPQSALKYERRHLTGELAKVLERAARHRRRKCHREVLATDSYEVGEGPGGPAG